MHTFLTNYLYKIIQDYLKIDDFIEEMMINELKENVEKIFWVLIWALKKEKPTTGVGFRGVFVHLTDQLSNFRIIPDYLKVVDFIEEFEHL